MLRCRVRCLNRCSRIILSGESAGQSSRWRPSQNIHGPATFSTASSLDSESDRRRTRSRSMPAIGFPRGPMVGSSRSSLVDARNLNSSTMTTSLGSNPIFNARQMSSMSGLTDLIPDFAKQYSIWGGSAVILTNLHSHQIPYWACMSLTNIFVRTSLFPLVIRGAKTSAKLANVAPEIQFLVSSFTKDTKRLKDANAQPSQRLELLLATWQSLRGIYKLHGVNPLDVLKSPLMQIPVFWYFSVDIRRLINGGCPELAQELADSGFLWVMDLTEPDPWYGLPILSGMLLYLNVELAVGKQSLSGETASKSNIAGYLKDGFQSLAVLMPCFMAQSPAGVQIYLLTSFIFTLFQGAALRHDPFRNLVGLAPRGAPPPEGKFVKEFIQYNKLERETSGVLSPSFQSSFRPYAQVMSPEELKRMEQEAKDQKEMNHNRQHGVDGLGVYAAEYQPEFQPSPIYLIVKQLADQLHAEEAARKNKTQKRIDSGKIKEIAPTPEEVMEAANRAERPLSPIQITPAMDDSPESNVVSLNKKNLLKRKKRGAKANRRRR